MDRVDSRPSAPAEAAWQPFTFGGVAAFARASWVRLVLLAGLAALMLGLTAVWFVRTAWLPAFERAVAALPVEAAIRGGRLVWPAPGKAILVDTPFLGVAVSLRGGPRPELGGDIQLTLGATGVRAVSLFGYRDFAYPSGADIPLGRSTVQAWWGAWEPFVTVACLGLVTVGLLVVWVGVGALLVLPLRIYTVLLDRSLTLGGAWRLAVAALLPGGLLVGLALGAYVLRRLALAELVLGHAVQVLVSVIYLMIAPTRLPPARSGELELTAGGRGERTNPFGGGVGETAGDPPGGSVRGPSASVFRAGDVTSARGAVPRPSGSETSGDVPFNPS